MVVSVIASCLNLHALHLSKQVVQFTLLEQVIISNEGEKKCA